ncbi:hypothetical protein D915_011208 [Fasciola hepatica]|uniref:Uncharacterized protein n=1 Tax=Fasciola hepatica TaxID=6192 RepID=A0A4E0R819_FASHE|nr:hypothetical protein D915_011208 [Fasciola hepatica]
MQKTSGFFVTNLKTRLGPFKMQSEDLYFLEHGTVKQLSLSACAVHSETLHDVTYILFLCPPPPRHRFSLLSFQLREPNRRSRTFSRNGTIGLKVSKPCCT